MGNETFENILNKISAMIIDFEVGDLLFLSELLDNINRLKECIKDSPESEKVANKMDNLSNLLLNGETSPHAQTIFSIGVDLLTKISQFNDGEEPEELLKSIDLFLHDHFDLEYEDDAAGEKIPKLNFFDLDESIDLNSESFKIFIVEHGKRKYAFVVDKIESKKEVVIKSLGEKLKKHKGISAATVLSGGKIGFIINIDQIVTVTRDITIIDNKTMQV